MTQLGKYDILEELGRGGFGIVYKARDLSLDRVVALKVLHPQLTVDPSFLERFRKEARALARVNHPNVVTIYEIGEVEGRVYIAMEYLPGGSLGDRLKDDPLSLDEAIKITGEAAAGLGAGHEEGLIHRDVKPGNILFNERGEAIVADFGLAKALQISSSSAKSSVGSVGTPYYRPPELWRGSPPPSPATDIYSLACVLFEMLTGQVLFQGDTPDQLITKHLLEDVQSLMSDCPVGVPAKIKPVLEKALAKEASQRYQSMGVFVSALSKAVKVGKAKQEATPETVQGRLNQRNVAQPRYGETQEKPQESRSKRPQTITKDPGDSQSTIHKKKAVPAWVPWAVLGGFGVILVLILVLEGLVGGEPMPTEVAQETEPSKQNFVPTLPEEATHEELQPTLTKTIRPTLTSTVTQTPTAIFGIGSTMVNPRDGAEMVYVPAGEFLMGISDEMLEWYLNKSWCINYCESVWFEDQQPMHTIYLDAYWIYKYEVTNMQFTSFLNSQGNHIEGDESWLYEGGYDSRIHFLNYEYIPEEGYENHPVLDVSWYGAQAYCEWVGGRLPTEAEWEKAARGEDGKPYPWGDDDPSCSLANYWNCSGGTSHVGSFPTGASPYGALDMMGNVYEWVWDWYDETYYALSPYRNPTGPSSGDRHVQRGGSWASLEAALSASYRFENSRGIAGFGGFRCILDEEP